MNTLVKILVVRFSSIGDIVLTTPIVRCLKNQLEGDVLIHFLTKKTYSSILEHNPYIDKIWTIDEKVSEVSEDLKNEGFDYIVDLHKNIRSTQVRKALKDLMTFSFDKLNWEKWLLVNFKYNKLPHDKHLIDRYFDGLHPISIENDSKGSDYFISEKEEEIIKKLPENFKQGYIALVPGAKFYTKQMPAEKITEIIDLLKKPVVLLGGKDEIEKGKKIEEGIKDKSLLFNAVGNCTINESAAFVKNAKVVLTHDTGLMHIAAAFQKPTVVVWGNTVPDFGMYPYMDKKQYINMEINDLSCRPCTKLGFSKCPKKHFKCMLEQDNNEIAEACLKFYNFPS